MLSGLMRWMSRCLPSARHKVKGGRIVMETATRAEKQAALRDKRARGLVAMGLVKREGDRFRVQAPSLRGRSVSYEVWRDETGKVRCSCLEYEEQSAQDLTFRCEHILAVKHALLAQNADKSVPSTDGSASEASAARAAEEEATAATPNTNETASEKRTERFERERRHSARSLAERKERKERTMKKNEQTAETTEQTAHRSALSSSEEPRQEEHGANVVPLAFAQTLRALRQPIDPKLIKQREGWRDQHGNVHMVEYVEWHTVADILDRIAPTWSHAVRSITQIGDMVAVVAAITIDGVTREGVGTGTADNETGIKKAEHDALKRAAIKFGIARELYQRESEVIERTGAGPQPGDFPRDPMAKTMADMITPRQLGMIRALAREAGVDADDECQAVLGCRVEDLSKRAASSLIDHLKNLPRAVDEAVRRVS